MDRSLLDRLFFALLLDLGLDHFLRLRCRAVLGEKLDSLESILASLFESIFTGNLFGLRRVYCAAGSDL